MKLTFFVPGKAAPQGSKRHVGHGIMIESARDLGPWRERVALAAHNAMLGQNMLVGAVFVELMFVLPRPKSAPKRSTPPAVKRPDIDKLIRACFDALTGICFSDDAHVTELHAAKLIAQIGEGPGVLITVATQEDQ